MRSDQQNQSTAQASASSARHDGASIINDDIFFNCISFSLFYTAADADALDPDDAASSSSIISIANENSYDEDVFQTR
eukprot:6229496-Karenia_brevis.AAC.1